MPISFLHLSEQLATLKGGCPFYADQLGSKQKISIKGLGDLTFPLNEIQVRAMLEKAQVAPFGKGRRTLVDRSVRNTWELDAEQLDLSDKGFQRSLRAYLSRAATEMNIKGRVKAIPYKLLIYEEGGFFTEHQDSEKLPGMFGTLLIGLPAAHEGGNLLIDPGNGQRVGFDFAENDAANFPAVAFFADRKHEVEPVTTGYRVVLVLNLVQANGGLPKKIDQAEAAKSLAAILAGQQDADHPFCLSLDHQYTDTNFSTEQLKGNDAVRVTVLREAAALSGLELRTGLIEQSVTAEWENADQFGQGYGYGSRRSRYNYDDYGSSTEPKTFAKVEVGEVHEEYLMMYNWLPEDGSNIGQLNFDEEDIVKPLDRPQEDPIDWSVEGYQGNWGMTTEFTYRHAGVLIWHPAATDKLVAKMPLRDRLQWIQTQLKRKNNEVTHVQLINVLTTVAEKLQNERYHSVDFAVVLPILRRLGEASLRQAEAVFSPWIPVLIRDFDKTVAKWWPKAVNLFGADMVGQVFHQVMDSSKELLYRNSWSQPPVLLAAITALLADETAGSNALGNTCLEKLPAYLQSLPERSRTEADYLEALLMLAGQVPEYKKWQDAELIEQLLPKLRNSTWIRKTLAPALIKDKTGGGAFLLTDLLEDLRIRTATPPQPYTDLSRPLPEGMEEPSGQFREFLTFLQDSKQKVFQYKYPKTERVMLEEYIKRNQLDVKGATLRTRPSHTLELTKTAKSYSRFSKQYAEDLELYQQLVSLPGTASATVRPATGATPTNATDFVLQLRKQALQEGYKQQDIKDVLRSYYAYFVDQSAGRLTTPQTNTAAVDTLLDKWEAQLTSRYTAGTDDALVPKEFPSLAALWAAAFKTVLEKG